MRRTVTLVVALALLLPALALARPRGQGAQRQELEEKIQALRIWKMTEFLKLDTETSARLFPILQQYDAQIGELDVQKNQLGNRVREIIENEEQVDKAEVDRLIEESFALQQKVLNIKHKEYKEVSKVLTPLQMVKFIAFEVRFQEEVQRLIHDIKHGDRELRRRNRQPPGQ